MPLTVFGSFLLTLNKYLPTVSPVKKEFYELECLIFPISLKRFPFSVFTLCDLYFNKVFPVSEI